MNRILNPMIYRIAVGALLLLGCWQLHAQRGVYVPAEGKTVFFENTSSQQPTTASPKASIDRKVYVPAEGITVFFGPSTPAIKDASPSINNGNELYVPAEGKTVFLSPRIAKGIQGILTPPDFDFSGTPIKWSVLHEDATFRGIDLQYMTRNYNLLGRDMLVHSDGSIYQLFTSGTAEGSVLSRIDARTGAIDWVKEYNVQNSADIQIDLSLFERADGNIELTGYQLLSNTIPNLFPVGLGLRKVVEANSGIVKRQAFSTLDNGGLIGRNTQGRFGRILPTEIADRYLVIDQFVTEDKQYTYLVRSMDANGKALDTLTRITRPQLADANIYLQSDAVTLPNGEIVFVAVQHGFFSDTASFYQELIWLNQDGELIRRKEITTLLNYASDTDIQVYNDQIILTANTFFNAANDDFRPQASVLILDLEGQVLHSMPKLQFNDQFLGQALVVPYRGDQYLLVGRLQDSRELVYWLNDFVGMPTTVGQLSPIVSNLDVNLLGLQQLANGDVLTFVKTRVDTTIYDDQSMQFETQRVGNWLYTFLIEADELGLVTDVVDIISKEPTVQLFPNPTNGEVRVQLNEAQPNGVQLRLFNSVGQLIENRLLTNNQTDLDLSSLAAGVYWLQVDFPDGMQRHEKLIKQ